MKHILLLFLILAFLSCENPKKVNNCGYGIISKTKESHHGHGIFSLNVYVDFEYKAKKYKGLYVEKFEGGYGSELFKENDSVVIKFDELKVNEINKIYCSRMYYREIPSIYRKKTKDSCVCVSPI